MCFMFVFVFVLVFLFVFFFCSAAAAVAAAAERVRQAVGSGVYPSTSTTCRALALLVSKTAFVSCVREPRRKQPHPYHVAFFSCPDRLYSRSLARAPPAL